MACAVASLIKVSKDLIVIGKFLAPLFYAFSLSFYLNSIHVFVIISIDSSDNYGGAYYAVLLANLIYFFKKSYVTIYCWSDECKTELNFSNISVFF